MKSLTKKCILALASICLGVLLFACAPNSPTTLVDTPADATPTPAPAKIVASRPIAATVGVVKITSDSVNIRAAANTDSEILGQADQGTYFQFTATEGDWNKIVFEDKTCFVSANLSVVEQVSDTQLAAFLAGTAAPTAEPPAESVAPTTDTSEETSTESVTSNTESSTQGSASSSLTASDIPHDEDGQKR